MSDAPTSMDSSGTTASPEPDPVIAGPSTAGPSTAGPSDGGSTNAGPSTATPQQRSPIDQVKDATKKILALITGRK